MSIINKLHTLSVNNREFLWLWINFCFTFSLMMENISLLVAGLEGPPLLLNGPVKKGKQYHYENISWWKINMKMASAINNHIWISSFIQDIHSFIHSFIFMGIFRFTVLFSYCPQIAEASLGGQCLYKTKYTLQMMLNWLVNKSYLSLDNLYERLEKTEEKLC